jgi:hypothetical protein
MQENITGMERLTEYTALHQAIPRTDLKNNGYEKCVKKLAEYEDMEEQGRLKKLPCKNGDDVYSIPSEDNYKLNEFNGYSDGNTVKHHRVSGVIFTNEDWDIECERDEDGGYAILFGSDYGKTWFLSEQEAEQALAKMRGRGSLIDIPCKPGNTVYFLHTDEIKELSVCEISLFKLDDIGLCIQLKCAIDGTHDYRYFSSDSIGKDLFVFEKEAQAALKTLQSGRIEL